MMGFKPPSLPLPEKGVKHPVYITKAISLGKICFRLIDNMKEFVVMFKELQGYYSKKNKCFIDSLSEDSITGQLFILKRDNVYHRVKVLQIWPDKSFVVHLIDEGFETIANEKELILNTNDEYLITPSQGFILPLRVEESFDNKKVLYLINYGLQKMANTETNFFISLSSENKVDLFYKDQKQNMVSVNDFVTEYIKQKQSTPIIKDSVVLSSRMEVVKNETFSKLYQTKLETPKFKAVLQGKSQMEGYEEWTMKCKQVFTPSEFYLKFSKDKKFCDFVRDMNVFYEKYSKQATDIAVNELYVTCYKGQWSRLLILKILEEKHYSCLLYDKGMVGTIDEEEIYELDDHFKLEPSRSLKSSLAFIKPVKEKWNKEACKFFNQKVKDTRFTVYPITTGIDDIFYCILVKDNVSIADLLVENEYGLVDI